MEEEKRLKATHQGILRIGDKDLACAVLEDGTRIISHVDVFKAFDRPARGSRARDKEINLPSFIAAENLKPYIGEEEIETITPIHYKNINGKNVKGYKAEIIPTLCNIYLQARKEEKLNKRQKQLAEISEMMVRSLSKVGIAALIDEATGYQEVRDKEALQKILDKYLAKEFAAWAKKFPDEFYREMFRLKGWAWKGMSVNRPSVVGKYTNDIVYSRLAPEILNELQIKNPKNEKGNRKVKHHQWLTDDIGNPSLSQHLHAVIGFMRATTNWSDFMKLLNRAFPKKNQQLSLLLDD
ncbi:MAG: P63C domain-containing protein [Candidatus Gastranaerophilales bacterium]|nr:P63C domain-containing protein [Candidatus Gastranaerophilales bacterium]